MSSRHADDSAPLLTALRVGLIGSGKMGLHHLKAVAATRHATVVGVADPTASEEELRTVLRPDAVVVATATELLERARPDVVHIVTPPGTHADLAALAIRAGCHVYVEKPFALTKAEAEHILSLASVHGVQVCAGHQVLFEPPALTARESLQAIGRVVHVESYFSFKTVRSTITPVEQAKDILPHAVYPIVDLLRAGTSRGDDCLEVSGLSVNAAGDVHTLLRLGKATAVLVVTLEGRPIEHYLKIVGTNGSLRADFIAGSVTRLVGPGSGPGVLFTPYRQAFQMVAGATRGFARRIFTRRASYPGLVAILERFYSSISRNTPPPLTPASILDTVGICERIGEALDEAERAQEQDARTRLAGAEAALAPVMPGQPLVLVTGGTGLLGRRVAEEVRQCGFPVRVVSRRLPPFSRRVAGVQYLTSDLSRGLDPDALLGVGLLVHCAAETTGGKADHQRNSVTATRRLLEAAAEAGVKRVIHVSSLAVLQTSRQTGAALDEATPVDREPTRGPYVWGKAESEVLAQQLGAEFGLQLKVIRPGPIVDYAAFQPPGRLGREIGPLYVAVGPKHGALSVCDVSTAARVIRSYVENFDRAPDLLNLVEAPPPSRRDLLARFLAHRPDLRVIWVPAWLLRAMSGPLKLVQRLALGAKQPMDVAAAFASERYHTDLAARTIERSGAATVPARPAR